MIAKGDRAPSLNLETSDGRTINLSNPGKPLVLYFYPKDDTG
jgi:peroxiredoxin Q/BCP